MICENCNTKNKDDARFCYRCGTPLNLMANKAINDLEVDEDEIIYIDPYDNLNNDYNNLNNDSKKEHFNRYLKKEQCSNLEKEYSKVSINPSDNYSEDVELESEYQSKLTQVRNNSKEILKLICVSILIVIMFFISAKNFGFFDSPKKVISTSQNTTE